jgi:hypothetical protein
VRATDLPPLREGILRRVFRAIRDLVWDPMAVYWYLPGEWSWFVPSEWPPKRPVGLSLRRDNEFMDDWSTRTHSAGGVDFSPDSSRRSDVN